MLKYLRRVLKPFYLDFLCFKGYVNAQRVKRDNTKRCWIIGTPDHKNLGDHAIAFATRIFIEKNIEGYAVEEITEGEFYNKFIQFKKSLKKNDIIILQGGGNLGNLYQYIEDIRRTLIKGCKKNPIILFPQSLYFTDDNIGEFEKNRTRLIYKKNKNIYYFAREQYTQNDMQRIFDNSRIYCVPDIVLSLNNVLCGVNEKRDGVICCLRNDKESAINIKQKEAIVNRIEAVKNVEYIDTVCDYMVTAQNRENELLKIWNRFSLAELVITDRLHGMIFALITNTPCIVLSNNNKKILGVYKWIENFNTVKFLENENDLSEKTILHMIDTIKNSENPWTDFNEKYFYLKKVLQEAAYNGEN